MDLNRDFTQDAAKIVESIYHSSNESLDVEQMKRLDLSAQELMPLIEFLRKHEFIETEQDDQTYYLTPETYQLIERGNMVLHAAILSAKQENKGDIDFTDEGLNDTALEFDEREAEYNHQNKKNMIRFIIVMGLVAMLMTIAAYLQTSSKDDLVAPELLDQMEVDLKHQVDSLQSLTRQE